VQPGTLVVSKTHREQNNKEYNILASCRVVEAGSNTSTVAQKVVGGDEMGTQCWGWGEGERMVINRGYKRGDLALQVEWGGDSRTRE
jgi:hypothetical protein